MNSSLAECNGYSDLSRAINPVSPQMNEDQLLWGGRFDLPLDQSLKAFHQHRCEGDGPEIIEATIVWRLEDGGEAADLTQAGKMAWVRARLKIVVRVPDSWPAFAASIFPGTLSGPFLWRKLLSYFSHDASVVTWWPCSW